MDSEQWIVRIRSLPKTFFPRRILPFLSYWSKISGFSGVSGIDIYTTRVNITQLGFTSNNTSTGAYLTLASIGGSWGGKINGKVLKILIGSSINPLISPAISSLE